VVARISRPRSFHPLLERDLDPGILRAPRDRSALGFIYVALTVVEPAEELEIVEVRRSVIRRGPVSLHDDATEVAVQRRRTNQIDGDGGAASEEEEHDGATSLISAKSLMQA
jgi:hypothetical protein